MVRIFELDVAVVGSLVAMLYAEVAGAHHVARAEINPVIGYFNEGRPVGAALICWRLAVEAVLSCISTGFNSD